MQLRGEGRGTMASPRQPCWNEGRDLTWFKFDGYGMYSKGTALDVG